MSLEIRRSEHFLLKVVLLKQLHLVRTDAHPHIIYSVLESFQLFFTNRELFWSYNLKHSILQFYETLQTLDFLLFALQKCHDEGLVIEVMEQIVIAFAEVVQVNADYGGQIAQNKVIFFEVFLAIFFEYVFI